MGDIRGGGRVAVAVALTAALGEMARMEPLTAARGVNSQDRILGVYKEVEILKVAATRAKEASDAVIIVSYIVS